MTASAALADTHKQAVRRFVARLRQDLEADFGRQLQRLGLRVSGQHVPVDSMRLSGQDVTTRRRLEGLLTHDATGEGSPDRGYQSVVRELTYTLLNRLVGLKAMEARGLLWLTPPGEPAAPAEQTEVLTQVPDQQYSRFLRDLRESGGARYRYVDDAEERLLHDGLDAAFRQLTKEVALIFDPDHEYACLWPTYGALGAAIARINQDVPQEAYSAPDLLGWVYQFFNRDEKERIRRESRGTPRTSYELAVINQFYTPSWVVKALVDNTLGRLWVQMHPDTSLRADVSRQAGDGRVLADYLVPGTGEDIGPAGRVVAAKPSGLKLVRDIAVLDPACGTMHFGQYAFALLERMYLEELERAGDDGWPEHASVADPREIPLAIVERNLFGVDIDPRAIQIASLGLMLTAKEAARRHGAAPSEISLRRTNLVAANAVPLGEGWIRNLVEELGPQLDAPELGEQLFTALWDNLRHVSELGPLVRVTEDLRRIMDQWVETQALVEGLRPPEPAAGDRFPFAEEADHERAERVAVARRALAQRAEEVQRRLTEAVEAAAAEGEDPEGRLFAEDTARGLALLRLLARRYDVIVMNPPYGAFVPAVKGYVRKAYPLTSNDIYAAFIDRATDLVEPAGYVGALVSGTFVNLRSFEKLRAEILLRRNPVLVLMDFGPGILDGATVEAAGVVLAGAP